MGGGFRFLETLGLRGFDTVTRNSLEYAGWMPALRFLMLDGCHWSVGKPVEGWVRVQEDGWMEARRLWKSERGGEGRGRERPVAKVRVGEVIQVNKRMTETQWRFVRNGGKREEKRKVEVPLERARPVVRKKRVRDIADMLADFAPKTFPTKK